MIGIINYGMGNLASVKNALDFLSIDNTFVSTSDELAAVDRLILPGVGAFGMAMQNLRDRQLLDELTAQVLIQKKPLLGICLGMQLLLDRSHEHGVHDGLGFISGEVHGFRSLENELPVPHVGWNNVKPHAAADLFVNDSTATEPIYYFVHSFYCQLSDRSQIAGTTEYGITFHSMLAQDNIFGCQFHPEKSQRAGLAIFTSFAKV